MTALSDMTVETGADEHARLVSRLLFEFPTLDEQDIVLIVRGTAADYADARIAQYVAIFVERRSRERLREIAVPAPRTPSGGE